MLKAILVITLWTSIGFEGLWLFLGIKMGPDKLPLAFFSLLGLWVLTLIGALLLPRLPLLIVMTSVANLAGCIYVRNLPPGYRNPSNFIHQHLMDFIMVVSSLGLYTLYIRTNLGRAQTRRV
jgi:hypothetical protein